MGRWRLFQLRGPSLPVVKANLRRNPFLGVFALATDRHLLVPRLEKIEGALGRALGLKPISTTIAGSSLIGALAVGNSWGILTSGFLSGEEEELLSGLGLRVGRLPGKQTAAGNMVLANDQGAVVSPELGPSALRVVEETLGVRVRRGTLAGLRNPGAAGVATNSGALVHPDATEQELRVVEEALGVPVDVGTACGGVKWVGACIIANSRGAAVGTPTTGPELGRIESALGLV